jgi:hypothetical protein
VGTTAGAAAVSAAVASTAGGTWSVWPPTRWPEVKVLRGTAVTAFGVSFT